MFFSLNPDPVNPSSSTTTWNLWQKQASFCNSDQSAVCYEVDLCGNDDEQSGNFDTLNGYGVPFPEISMNNVQWSFSCYNQQPEFYWVQVLVEDDHQPVGLVRKSSLEEEVTAKSEVEYSCVEQERAGLD